MLVLNACEMAGVETCAVCAKLVDCQGFAGGMFILECARILKGGAQCQ